jgi:hypothetical protein
MLMIFNVVLGKNMFRDQRLLLLGFWFEFLDIKNFRDPPHSNALDFICFRIHHPQSAARLGWEFTSCIFYIFRYSMTHLIYYLDKIVQILLQSKYTSWKRKTDFMQRFIVWGFYYFIFHVSRVNLLLIN